MCRPWDECTQQDVQLLLSCLYLCSSHTCLCHNLGNENNERLLRHCTNDKHLICWSLGARILLSKSCVEANEERFDSYLHFEIYIGKNFIVPWIGKPLGSTCSNLHHQWITVVLNKLSNSVGFASLGRASRLSETIQDVLNQEVDQLIRNTLTHMVTSCVFNIVEDHFINGFSSPVLSSFSFDKQSIA